MTSRRIAILAVAVLLGACGGGGGGDLDATPATDGATATTDDRPGTDERRPHPCDLVPLEQVSEIFGEPAAEPERATDPIEQCIWTVQAAIDSPGLDNAGKQLSLGYATPPAGFESSADDYFEVLRNPDSGLDLGTVDGFGDDAFTLAGQLYVLHGDVIFVAMAGLSDDAPAIGARDGLMRVAIDAL